MLASLPMDSDCVVIFNIKNLFILKRYWEHMRYILQVTGL